MINQLFQDLATSLNSRHCECLFADGAPVWIYGAGNVGKDVYRVLTARGVCVHGFLDRNAKDDDSWNGIPIRKPDDSTLDFTSRKKTYVVIGIFNRDVEIPPIVRMLKDLGFLRVTTFLNLHDRYASDFGDRFWLTDRAFYLGMESQVQQVYDLFEDQKSRDLYLAILKYRFQKEYAALPPPDRTSQYFPSDLPSWNTPLRFIDCGAFDGDTLRELAGTQVPVDAVAAFEPDQANFSKLAEYIQQTIKQPNSPTESNPIVLYPCGVGANTSQVRFASGQGEGSHASDSGDTLIQCVSIDQALPNFRPNLIKMDIEGSESDALWGARNTITSNRPGLAICLYHCPAHLWQLPLLVERLTGGGGKFFLRSHCNNGFELVLYWQS